MPQKNKSSIVISFTIIIIYIVLYGLLMFVNTWAINASLVFVIIAFAIISAIMSLIVTPSTVTMIKAYMSINGATSGYFKTFIYASSIFFALIFSKVFFNEFYHQAAPNNFVVVIFSVWTIGALAYNNVRAVRGEI